MQGILCLANSFTSLGDPTSLGPIKRPIVAELATWDFPLLLCQRSVGSPCDFLNMTTG